MKKLTLIIGIIALMIAATALLFAVITSFEGSDEMRKKEAVPLAESIANISYGLSTANKAISSAAEDSEPLKAGDYVDLKKYTKKQRSALFHIYGVSAEGALFRRINGNSYTANPNIGLSDLRYIRVLHYDFEGKVRVGEIMVNKAVASDVLSIFKELYAAKYQINSMKLVDDYYVGTNDRNVADDNSIRDDNTSGFNYRTVAHTSNLSRHAMGLAIDINPFENPYVVKQNGKWVALDMPESTSYISNRTPDRPHVITHSDLAYRTFRKYGFSWGGDWSMPDYQHFERR